MLQTLVSEDHGCLAIIQEQKWEIQKGENLRPVKRQTGSLRACSKQEQCFLLSSISPLQSLLQGSLSELEIRRVRKNSSHFCAWCAPGGEGAMSLQALVLWSTLSLFTRAHPRLVAVFSHLGKTQLLGWVNDLFNSYMCFKIRNLSCLTFYSFHSKSSQVGQKEQPNFCEWSRINTLNAW